MFIECMVALKVQYDHDLKCSEAMAVLFPDDYISLYNNEALSGQLIKVMKCSMGDNHKDSWIDYFIYELDFGSKYSKGCASYVDGGDIDLSTAATLYKFLKKEKKLRGDKV